MQRSLSSIGRISPEVVSPVDNPIPWNIDFTNQDSCQNRLTATAKRNASLRYPQIRQSLAIELFPTAIYFGNWSKAFLTL